MYFFFRYIYCRSDIGVVSNLIEKIIAYLSTSRCGGKYSLTESAQENIVDLDSDLHIKNSVSLTEFNNNSENKTLTPFHDREKNNKQIKLTGCHGLDHGNNLHVDGGASSTVQELKTVREIESPIDDENLSTKENSKSEKPSFTVTYSKTGNKSDFAEHQQVTECSEGASMLSKASDESLQRGLNEKTTVIADRHSKDSLVAEDDCYMGVHVDSQASQVNQNLS